MGSLPCCVGEVVNPWIPIASLFRPGPALRSRSRRSLDRESRDGGLLRRCSGRGAVISFQPNQGFAKVPPFGVPVGIRGYHVLGSDSLDDKTMIFRKYSQELVVLNQTFFEAACPDDKKGVGPLLTYTRANSFSTSRRSFSH